MIRGLLLVLCCAITYSSGHAIRKWQVSTGDGQPGCRTRYEFTKLWRNNLERGQYWECVNIGQAAVARHCPPSTAFLDHWQTCVPDSMYEWTPPYDPPSSPGVALNPCWDLAETGDSCNSTDPCCCDPITPTTTVPVISTTTMMTTTTTTTQAQETTTQASFICTADRLGLRWSGPDSNTYWECYGLMEEPFLISCPPGFVFDFVRQTCTL